MGIFKISEVQKIKFNLYNCNVNPTSNVNLEDIYKLEYVVFKLQKPGLSAPLFIVYIVRGVSSRGL